MIGASLGMVGLLAERLITADTYEELVRSLSFFTSLGSIRLGMSDFLEMVLDLYTDRGVLT